MKCYYWESECFQGEVTADNDNEAISLCKKAVTADDKLLVVYRENEKTSWVPFITVWEEEDDNKPNP